MEEKNLWILLQRMLIFYLGQPLQCQAHIKSHFVTIILQCSYLYYSPLKNNKHITLYAFNIVILTKSKKNLKLEFNIVILSIHKLSPPHSLKNNKHITLYAFNIFILTKSKKKKIKAEIKYHHSYNSQTLIIFL
jgi:hypothetical protein